MRKGDIVVNPWVSAYFNGELNPNYATIYLGDNKSLDYNGRVCEWADKIYKDNPKRNTPWKVIGHIDLYGIAELAIRDAVFAEEIADTPQTEREGEINRQDVLTYIDRVANSGMGKKKSLEYIRKYVEKADRKTENSSEKPNNCKTEPQTEYDKGLQLFADILFDKEKNEQFLKECKAMGIEPQTERSE